MKVRNDRGRTAVLCGGRQWWVSACLLCGLVLSIASTATADDAYPLLVEVEGSSYISRSGGPVPLSLRVQWGGQSGVVNGDLAMELRDGADLLGVYVLRDLFISSGQQRYEFLLPPVSSGVWQTQCDLKLTFTNESGTHQLQDQIVRLPGAARRTVVITVATSASSYDRQVDPAIIQAFQLETFSPEWNRSGRNQSVTSTLVRSMSVRELPTQPLSHCVQDMIILPNDAFAGLSDAQAQALLGWVRAGGSACILLDDTLLTGTQVERLNELLGAEADAPIVIRQTTGKPLLMDQPDRLVSAHCGLGRVVVAHEQGEFDRADDFSTPEWRQAITFLWKFRAEQMPHVNDHGVWTWDVGRDVAVRSMDNFGSVDDLGLFEYISKFRPKPVAGGSSDLLVNLLPQGMQLVPLWLMAVTLLLYVLAIGPVDYYLLGAVRARKYTWGLFPVVTIAFTAGAIWVSNQKMQGDDYGGHVLVRDVIDDGLVARENELYLSFFASSKTSETELVQTLFTPLDHRVLGAATFPRQQYQQPVVGDVTPLIVEGMFPTRARIIQSVPQWTPQLNRTLQIPLQPSREASGFDWDLPVNPRSADEVRFLRDRLVAAFGENVHAQVIRRGNRDAGTPYSVQVIAGMPELMETPPEFRDGRMSEHGWRVGFVKSSAIRDEPGLFSVVSQVAPKCDDYLEDLAIWDSSSEDSLLLLVVTSRGNQWEVYRKVYEIN